MKWRTGPNKQIETIIKHHSLSPESEYLALGIHHESSDLVKRVVQTQHSLPLCHQ